MVHKYFKKNKDQHKKNYYRKITEENKWLKKLSPIKMYQTTEKPNDNGKIFLRMEEVSLLIIKEIAGLILKTTRKTTKIFDSNLCQRSINLYFT